MSLRNPYLEHKPSGGSGSYLKFEDGKTINVVILTDPAIFESIYEGRASTKYAWLIYNINDKEIQIMQLPKSGYITLASIAADVEYGNPLENSYILKITRTGQRQQTKYSIVPVLKQVAIPEDIKEQFDEIDLVERLKASPNNENVAWVFDEVDGKRPKRTSQADSTTKHTGSEIVNLDEIDMPL